MQVRNNMTKMRAEARSCSQDCHKNDVFTLSVALLTQQKDTSTILSLMHLIVQQNTIDGLFWLQTTGIKLTYIRDKNF